MGTVTRSEFLAKDEVNQALSELKIAVRRALPEGSFAEREGAALMLLVQEKELTLPAHPPADTSGYTACYPACALDPNAAFPNEASAGAYSRSYEIVGNALLLAEGIWRLGGWALGRGVAEGVGAAARSGAALSKTEVAGLRNLFGKSTEGAQALLGRLRAGEAVPLPQGVTPQTLQTYRGIAENAIQAGKDTLGVQAARKEAIDLLLKAGGGP